ncbi:MAG: hypothetical protein HY615_06235 [Candidatus Rokubacteria bacterium]|nr:hypothetical protein [Candidatus Rokubacteria bacterium]
MRNRFGLVGGGVARRLVVGWTFGAVVSLAGVAASALLDLPTGATVVCTFALALAALWAVVGARRP